jgi:glycosyltransferase involved in cell wall biosynthesis
MTISTEPSISVIIPTFGRPEQLERCLEAVSRQTWKNFDVIVVDNSAGNEATRKIAQSHGARYVSEPRRGLCRARNRGALVSSADIVAYLDDDAVPEPDWLQGFVKAFENERVMGVSGRTVPLAIESDAEKLYASVRGSAYNRPKPLVVDRGTPNWFGIAGFGGIGPGCNMALRRTAFEFWPGFHEGTDRGTPVYGGGEQHAFYSLVDRGFAVAYTPDAVVKHPYPPTMDALKTRYLRDLTASTAYFTMMLVEESRNRSATLRYLWESIRGTPRSWRGATRARLKVVPFYLSAGALMAGPFRYLQGLLAQSDPR